MSKLAFGYFAHAQSDPQAWAVMTRTPSAFSRSASARTMGFSWELWLRKTSKITYCCNRLIVCRSTRSLTRGGSVTDRTCG